MDLTHVRVRLCEHFSFALCFRFIKVIGFSFFSIIQSIKRIVLHEL